MVYLFVTGYRYIARMYCLAVLACLYSGVIEHLISLQGVSDPVMINFFISMWYAWWPNFRLLGIWGQILVWRKSSTSMMCCLVVQVGSYWGVLVSGELRGPEWEIMTLLCSALLKMKLILLLSIKMLTAFGVLCFLAGCSSLLTRKSLICGNLLIY